MKHRVIKLSIKISAALATAQYGRFWGVQASGKEWSAIQKEIWEMEKAYWNFWRQKGLDGSMALHPKTMNGK